MIDYSTEILFFRRKKYIFAERIVNNVVFIDMVTRIDFERYINLPIAEQRNRCNRILTENNGDLPNFEDAAIDIGMPIEDSSKMSCTEIGGSSSI